MANLPNDPEGINGDRALWAREALEAFQYATGTQDGDALGDLLGDLMHLCDRTGVYGSFEEGLRRARVHYREETRD